jgi:hypothetical protein
MNNLPDKNAKLINFLRQNRGIVPSELPELEDRLMSEIDLLPIEPQLGILRSWRRYIVGAIGVIMTGIAGVTMFQIVNPPEPSIAELDGLNLYLEAHALSLTDHPEIGLGDREDLADLDTELF